MFDLHSVAPGVAEEKVEKHQKDKKCFVLQDGSPMLRKEAPSDFCLQMTMAEDVLDQRRDSSVDGGVDAQRELGAIQSMPKILQDGRGSGCCQDGGSAGVNCPNLRSLEWEIGKSATQWVSVARDLKLEMICVCDWSSKDLHVGCATGSQSLFKSQIGMSARLQNELPARKVSRVCREAVKIHLEFDV
eukprot:s2448_g8.t1